MQAFYKNLKCLILAKFNEHVNGTMTAARKKFKIFFDGHVFFLHRLMPSVGIT